MQPDVGVVIAAAGKSERLGGTIPKQFRPLAGVPILLRAIRPFLAHQSVREVVIAVPPEVLAQPAPWLAEACGERLRLVAGGPTRVASVAHGFGVLQPACSIVLVHDGARPFPSREVIDAVIAAARQGSPAIAAIPLFDTLKEAAGSSVRRTIPRAALWRAQTPQGFPREMLARALSRADTRESPPTDESQLVEELGETVRLIPDSARNLKITTEDEFRLAEALVITPP